MAILYVRYMCLHRTSTLIANVVMFHIKEVIESHYFPNHILAMFPTKVYIWLTCPTTYMCTHVLMHMKGESTARPTSETDCV